MNMVKEEEIIQTLTDKFPGGKISCTEAREVADELGIVLSRMGELCDKAGLKIYGCELGCF